VNFDANNFLLSMLIGSVGFVAFFYGKKMKRLPQMVAGLTLMAYPYFVSNLWVMGGIAIVVLGLMYLAIRAGV
jgi:hypothetical protein